MWKLTISQKRKSEYSEYASINSVELFSDDIHELVEVVDKLTCLDTEAIETNFKIELVTKEGEE